MSAEVQLSSIGANININPPISIDINKCMSRKNKSSGFNQQCPYKKKIGDYCKIHANSSIVQRIDENTNKSINQDMKINIVTSLPKINLAKIKMKKDSSHHKKKIIKIVKKDEPYTHEEFLKLDLETITYNRLIATLKHYFINIKGDTQELYRLVREFFNTKWIDKNIVGLVDSPNTLSTEKSYIPPSLENISGRGLRDRNICDNTTDFQDLTPVDEIPNLYYFSFEDTQGRVYGCDFRSFHQLVETSKSAMKHRDMNVPNRSNWRIENPYTREKIHDKFLERYEKKREILFQNRIPMEYPALVLDEETALNLEALEVFQIIYKFGYPVDHQWFMNLSKDKLKNFYLKLEDIWNYRLQLTETQKRSIIPNNDIFTKDEKQSVEKGYAGSHPETMRKLRSLLLKTVKKMVSDGETKADCINGAIYVLTALVEVSGDAANAMPGFVYVSGINDFEE